MLRLYLDTGDLHVIADGKAPARDVDALRQAALDTNTALVIGVQHAWDMPSDKDTIDRVVAAIDSFPCVVFAYPPEPHVFEQTGEANDLSLDGPVITVREIFDHPDARSGRALIFGRYCVHRR